MRHSRKVFAVCIGTAVAMVASLLVAIPLGAKPAWAAPIPYPYQNPGGDLTTSIPLPFSASDVTAWAHNVLAPSFGLGTGADLTAIGLGAASYADSIPTPPPDLLGGSPTPDKPPLAARDAATFTVTATSTVTSTLTVTVPASAVPIEKKFGAALVAWIAGVTAYVATCFIVGMIGARGLPIGTTTFEQLKKARPGLVTLGMAAAFGAFNIALLSTNDSFLGVSLNDGALWGSIVLYALLDAGLGATVTYLMAWFGIKGGLIGQAILNGLHTVYDNLYLWFEGVPRAGSAQAEALANLALLAALEEQIAHLGEGLGVAAMGTGGFVTDSRLTIDGRTTCADAGFGGHTGIPGEDVAVNVCNGGPFQYWRGFNTRGCTESDWDLCGSVPFQVTSNGLCLAPANPGATTPQPLLVAWCDGSPDQLWTVNRTEGAPTFGLDNYASGLCLHGDGQVGQQLLDATCYILDPGQYWHGFDEEVGGSGGSGGSGVQIAVASYIYPTDAAWDRLIAASSAKESVLVANVLNGPGSERVDAWASVIDRAHASGKKVLGYVDTGYFGLADSRRTRLGSLAPADWFMQIEADVNAWYRLYGVSMDGIFFDDGFNACGAGNVYAEWYRELNDYAKGQHPGALTALNPGTIVPQCYDGTADILATFEGDYNAYVGTNPNPALNYQDLGWTPASSELWHIIYGTGAGNVQDVVDLAEQRNAGYLEITDDVLPNPYDTLPSDAYWSAEQAAVAGGYPAINGPTPYADTGEAPATPAGLTLSGNDYSSATLTWSAVAGTSRYLIDVNGQSLVVPATMTGATIGGLTPGGHPYSFTVRAQGANGDTSSSSNFVTATTLSLPGGKTVSNVTVSASAGSTTITADFLVPYAFHRVYVWRNPTLNGACGLDSPGWPINYNTWDFVCGTYMIEGSTLFRYTGTPSGDFYPWSWTPVGSVQVDVNGYTYTWTVPIGTSTAPTTNVVIQAEGYDPLTNIFVPCPTLGGGPDGNGRYCA